MFNPIEVAEQRGYTAGRSKRGLRWHFYGEDGGLCANSRKANPVHEQKKPPAHADLCEMCTYALKYIYIEENIECSLCGCSNVYLEHGRRTYIIKCSRCGKEQLHERR